MLAPDAKPAALGDGWLRLMRFDLSAAVPTIAVSTYSTHFHSSSERMPTYAALYRPHEQPTMSDTAFLGEANFTLRLQDFRHRYGPAQSSKQLMRSSGAVLRPGQENGSAAWRGRGGKSG